MAYFAELDQHEQQMLNIWMEYWAEGFDGAFDDLEEEPSFEEWLEEQIAFYSDEEEGWSPEFSAPYRQALAEWQA